MVAKHRIKYQEYECVHSSKNNKHAQTIYRCWLSLLVFPKYFPFSYALLADSYICLCCANRLVDKINRSVGQDVNSQMQIGVLDIYGFECFKNNR